MDTNLGNEVLCKVYSNKIFTGDLINSQIGESLITVGFITLVILH